MTVIPFRNFDDAAARVKPFVRRTPLIPCGPSRLVETGADIWFKPECLQV